MDLKILPLKSKICEKINLGFWELNLLICNKLHYKSKVKFSLTIVFKFYEY